MLFDKLDINLRNGCSMVFQLVILFYTTLNDSVRPFFLLRCFYRVDPIHFLTTNAQYITYLNKYELWNLTEMLLAVYIKLIIQVDFNYVKYVNWLFLGVSKTIWKLRTE